MQLPSLAVAFCLAVGGFAPPALAAAEQPSNLCQSAREVLDGDEAMAAAVRSAFGNPAYAPEDAQDCLYPLRLLNYKDADVLIVNNYEGPGDRNHGGPESLSAYVLRREGETTRLVTIKRDFTTTDVYGNAGKIEPARFGGDDAFTITSRAVHQGYSFDDLSVFLFRNGQLIALDSLRTGASNGGAVEDENQVVSVTAEVLVGMPKPDNLTLNYTVSNKRSERKEQVVLALEGKKWVTVSGTTPPEFDEIGQ